MMKISKIHSWLSSYCLWLLGISATLILFGAFSRPYLQEANPVECFELPISMRKPSKGGNNNLPVLAYVISGSSGDGKRMMRLLKAVYHPRNQYLLQLSGSGGLVDSERRELAVWVRSVRAFCGYGNVNVVGRGYGVNKMGCSAVAATLHAAALLLKMSQDWDWFVTLSASDYPLMSQDDVLHAFSFLPRDVNFLDYTSDIDWQGTKTTDWIVVDPDLHLTKTREIFYAAETRSTPEAFKIYGGSPWVILTRAFMEFCVQGWDNLPRKLLMYFTNTLFPLQLYFHTVLCNSPNFQNTTVDNDLGYTIWNRNAKKPQVLTSSNYADMVTSKQVFARPFREDDAVLQELDRNVLNRTLESLVPGKWCLDTGGNNVTENGLITEIDNCMKLGDIDSVNAGFYGEKLAMLFYKLGFEGRLRANSCNATA